MNNHDGSSTKGPVFTTSSFRLFFGFLIFILASALQHDCHAHLASLKDLRTNGVDEQQKSESHYRLPKHPAWGLSLTPHYLAECLIYLSISIVAAPCGEWLNWTLCCGLIFVTVNLGITAHGAKSWYEQKFGKGLLKDRARMIPFIY